MNNNIRLVKVIADLAVFLEFTNEDLLDPDAAIEAMEQIAADLQLLDEKDRSELSKMFHTLSKEYKGDKSEYVKGLPESLGLI